MPESTDTLHSCQDAPTREAGPKAHCELER